MVKYCCGHLKTENFKMLLLESMMTGSEMLLGAIILDLYKIL